jgi:Hemolysins and related proteins containing CBS domains
LKRLIRKIKGQDLKIEELVELFEELKAQGILQSSVVEIIQSILELSDRQIEEIMVPRIDMVYISSDATLKDAVKVYRKRGFLKLPVVKERTDNVIGILYIKELLKHLDELESLKVADLANLFTTSLTLKKFSTL